MIFLSFKSFSQLPNDLPKDGLILYWPFNGNANDASGNGNNGSVNGATLTTDRFGINNAAYKFNGASSIFLSNFNSIIGNSAFSVSFWVKPNGTGWMVAFGTSSNGNGFNCGNKRQGSNSFDAQIWKYDYSSNQSTDIPQNEYTYLTIVYGNNNMKVYKNGKLATSEIVNYVTTNIRGGVLQIGKQIDFNEYFIGDIDDIGIWNRVLNQQEIEQIYNSSSPIKTISIGSQIWMQEDINTTIYNNGDFIFEAKTEKDWETAGKEKIGCFRKLKNGSIIYNGYAILDSRGIAPNGFKIPSSFDFKKLIDFLGGGAGSEGKAAMSLAKYNWSIEDWNEKLQSLEDKEIKGNNKSGFSAKPSGFSRSDGSGYGGEWDDNCSFWWTFTKNNTDDSNNNDIEDSALEVMDIGWCSQDIGGGLGAYILDYGFAVRCIKSEDIKTIPSEKHIAK